MSTRRDPKPELSTYLLLLQDCGSERKRARGLQIQDRTLTFKGVGASGKLLCLVRTESEVREIKLQSKTTPPPQPSFGCCA